MQDFECTFQPQTFHCWAVTAKHLKLSVGPIPALEWDQTAKREMCVTKGLFVTSFSALILRLVVARAEMSQITNELVCA